MVSIKRKVTIKQKSVQEEVPRDRKHLKVTLKTKYAEKVEEAEVKPQTNSEATKTQGSQDDLKVSLKTKQKGVSEEKKDAPLPNAEKKQSNISTPKEEKKSNKGIFIGMAIVAALVIGGALLFSDKDATTSENATESAVESIAQNNVNSAALPNELTEQSSKDVSYLETSEEANAEDINTEANNSSAVATRETVSSPSGSTNNTSEQIKDANANSANELSLQNAHEPSEVQTNSSYSRISESLSSDAQENAQRVIRGEFGNGQERKDRLGSSYAEIQNKVNEMYRNGLVH